MDVTAVRSHGPPRDRKTEAEPGAISPSSVAEGLEQIRFASGNAAALVFNLDEKALAFRMRAEDHGAAGSCVLERIVQQVHHCRREQLRVGVEGQRGIDRRHSEPDAAILRVEATGRGDLVDERGHADGLAPLLRGGQPDLTELAVHEGEHAGQAAAQHRSGTAVDGDRSALQCVKGKERTIKEVPKLVSRLPETLDFLFGPLLCDEPGVLRDRFSDRHVEATIQRMKLFDGDRCVLLERDLGDRLANVTVVVDHLRHVEAGCQQLRAVPRGGGTHRVTRERCRRRFQPQGLGQLRQKEGHPMLDLTARDRRPRPASDAVPRAGHDVVAMQVDEFVQHQPSVAITNRLSNYLTRGWTVLRGSAESIEQTERLSGDDEKQNRGRRPAKATPHCVRL